jgi:hypothetical protein
MIHLAEIMYSEDKGDNIYCHTSIFRLVDSFSPDSFTITLDQKVRRWFKETFPDEKYQLLNIEINEPI